MGALDIAVTGMASAEVRLAASAHNVANLVTENVRPLRTTQVSVEPGAGSVAFAQQTALPEPVDYAQEFVQQVLASLQYRASARVVATDAAMRGSLLDLFA